MPERIWTGRSLTLRVLILLTVALMPLGLIAVWQTDRVTQTARQQAQATLMSLTESAANPLQSVLQRSFGAANALSAAVAELQADPEACSAHLRRFRRANSQYVFVGFIAADGMMRCSDDGRVYDFSDAPDFADGIAEPRRNVTRSEAGLVSGQPVIIITQPVFDGDNALLGFLSMSFPEQRLAPPILPFRSARPPSFVTFNDRGDVLTSSPGAEIEAVLPQGYDLPALTTLGTASFGGPDEAGLDRQFALVQLEPGVAWALSSWSADAIGMGRLDRIALTTLMPLLMWLASLLVAFLALERLVFRHIRVLGRQMRVFARSRRTVNQPMLAAAGKELANIESDFREMSQSILQDEARLEDNLREKNVLLKEVHHRVKNNLQLISSIINMQSRKLSSTEARDALRRVQDRVSSLAAVHRTLYQADDMGRIDVGALVSDVAVRLTKPSGETAVTIETDSIEMEPDRAVALSLAVGEALANATSHLRTLDDAGWLTLRLTRRETPEGGGEAMLYVANACRGSRAGGGDVLVAPRERVTATGGLGMQLLEAFARQLDGRLEIAEPDGAYEVRLTFPLEVARGDARDY